jgi:hypothetical protein
MKQNEPAFCSPRIAIHSENPEAPNVLDRQNQSILSIPIDFTLHATICNRLIANDLPQRATNRRKQNDKTPERQTSLCAGMRPCDRQNGHGSSDKCHHVDFGKTPTI